MPNPNRPSNPYKTPNPNKPSSGLTPVPTLFLTDLKEVLKSVDTNVQKTNQEIVRIQEQTKNSDKRISDLEVRTEEIRVDSYTCRRKDSIQAIAEDTKDLGTRQSVLEVALKSTQEEVNEGKTQKNQATYWLLGIVVLVISGSIGWIVTLTSLTNEVGFIKEQQQEIKNSLSTVQQRIIAETTKTRRIVEVQAENAARELDHNAPADRRQLKIRSALPSPSPITPSE